MGAVKIFKTFKTLLDVDWPSISDGQVLARSGTSIVGTTAGAGLTGATSGNVITANSATSLHDSGTALSDLLLRVDGIATDLVTTSTASGGTTANFESSRLYSVSLGDSVFIWENELLFKYPLHLLDAGGVGTFDTVLTASSSTDLTADRALTLDMQNAAHTLQFGTITSVVTVTNLSKVFAVSTYGAVGDATTDDTDAIQDALDAAFAAKGGIVKFEAKSYKIAGTLSVPADVILEGESIGSAAHNQNAFQYFGVANDPLDTGTTLLITGGNGAIESATATITVGINGGIRRLKMYWPNQSRTAGTPTAYPYAIRFPLAAALNLGGGIVEDVELVNPYRGIDIQNGRVSVNRLFGQPIFRGIKIDYAADVVRLSNIHFNPFWSYANGPYTWSIAHGIAFDIARADGIAATNCFVMGYVVGFYFHDNGNGNPYGEFTNCFTDEMAESIQVDSTNFPGIHFTNCGFTQGNFGLLHLGGFIEISNSYFWAAASTAQIVNSTGGRLSFHNNFINDSAEEAISLTNCIVNIHDNTFRESGCSITVTDANTGGRIVNNASGANAMDVNFTVVNNGVFTSAFDPSTQTMSINGNLSVGDALTTRANLGLTIGTNVQAYDAGLLALAGGSDFVQFTGPTTSTKVFTLPNASSTLATLAGSEALTNKTLNGTTPTTAGLGVLGVTNPGAISFLKIAADNSVSTRTVTQTQSDLSVIPQYKDSQTLGAAASSITFSAIPGTYKDLRIKICARGTNASANVQLYVRFNADSGANYNWHYVETYGTTGGDSEQAGTSDTQIVPGIIVAATGQANAASGTTIHVPNYSGSTFLKQIVSQNGWYSSGATANAADTGSAIWMSTSAITSVTLSLSAGNFATGTTATLIAE